MSRKIIRPDKRADNEVSMGDKRRTAAQTQRLFERTLKPDRFAAIDKELLLGLILTIKNRDLALYIGSKFDGHVLSIKIYDGDEQYGEFIEDDVDFNELCRQVIERFA